MDTSEPGEMWEQRVNGREMEQYRALKPCLRRPCGWGLQCRMLHVTAGKSHKHSDFKNTNSQECCRGTETLLECAASAASGGRTEERAREDRAHAPRATCGQEEGEGTVSSQRERIKVPQEELSKKEIQKEQDKDQLQVQKQVLLKRTEGGPSPHGEVGQEAQEMREARTRPPQGILYSR